MRLFALWIPERNDAKPALFNDFQSNCRRLSREPLSMKSHWWQMWYVTGGGSGCLLWHVTRIRWHEKKYSLRSFNLMIFYKLKDSWNSDCEEWTPRCFSVAHAGIDYRKEGSRNHPPVSAEEQPCPFIIPPGMYFGLQVWETDYKADPRFDTLHVSKALCFC